MKYLRGPVVALVTFFIGFAISPIQFEVIRIACGKLEGGGGFNSTVVRSSDNVEVFIIDAHYDSINRANEVFDQRVAEAVYVWEVTPKLDKQGKVLGRRAVVLLFDKEYGRYLASVFWTDGTHTLHYIDSQSLTHVLEVESRSS